METSPAQILINYRAKTLFPNSGSLLRPKVVENAAAKVKMNQLVDRHTTIANGLRSFLFPDRSVVQVVLSGKQDKCIKADVSKQPAPRSYEVVTETGQALRRNRRRLRKTTETPLQQTVEEIEIPEYTIQALPRPRSDELVDLPGFQPDEPVPQQLRMYHQVSRTRLQLG